MKGGKKEKPIQQHIGKGTPVERNIEGKSIKVEACDIVRGGNVKNWRTENVAFASRKKMGGRPMPRMSPKKIVTHLNSSIGGCINQSVHRLIFLRDFLQPFQTVKEMNEFDT